MKTIDGNTEEDSVIDLREYFFVLYRRRWVIVSFTLLACTFAVVYSFLMRPVYAATAQVLIRKESPKVLNNIDDIIPSEISGKEYYQTQYKILQSPTMARRVYDLLGGYETWDRFKGRAKGKDENVTLEERIKGLTDNVAVKLVPNTELMQIIAYDVNPEFAAKIANAWTESYISYILDTKFNASQYASGWLEKKIVESKKTFEEAERKLQEYRKKNNMVALVQDGAAGQKTTMLEALYAKKSELEIGLSQKSEYYKAKHPEILGIKSEIASVEKKIEAEEQKELLSRDREIEYNMLRRNVDTAKEMYESLLKRISETEVAGELKTTNISVVDAASVPKKPVRPDHKRNFLMALLIGLIGGGGMAFFIENLDQSLKTQDDLKDFTGLTILSVIPRISDKEIHADIEFISLKEPQSPISESYRHLRTSILFTAVEKKKKVILVTSSEPQEGKSTTVMNMAVVMAQSGDRTLLIDADLRQPRIEKILNIKMEKGLSDVLAGDAEDFSVITKTDIERLDVIGCGRIPPNPSELLGSRKMDEILLKYSEKYDRIIIDSPPVLAVTDAVVLAGKVDGTMLVVRAGKTHRKAVLHVKEMLQSISSSGTIGAVLNMAEDTSSGSGYYYGYYRGRYGRYGQPSGKS